MRNDLSIRLSTNSSSSSSSVVAAGAGRNTGVGSIGSHPTLPLNVMPFDFDEKQQTELAKKAGECLKTWEGHSSFVTALSVLPNGWVVSGGGDNTIKCWKVDERGGAQCLGTWEGHSDSVYALSVLPNGWVVSGSGDYTSGEIKCWEVDERGGAQCLKTWEGHSYSVNALAVLPNGWVVSGSGDKTIKCWKVDERGEAKCLGTWEGHSGYVLALSVLPNGWVVSGSYDHTIKCWKVDERGGADCIGTWKGHSYSVIALSVLKNGWVVSGSGDKSIKCWRGGAAMVILPKHLKEESDERYYDERMLNALAKAYQWRLWIEEGKFANVAEIRRHEKIGKGYACRIYRLNLLAPQIVEAIVTGTQPHSLRLEDRMKKTFFTYLWQEQLEMLGFNG
ncbi:MAG: hypothetical protein K0R24_1872 [Gammaproteobacteria bacterium]|nr:hypothetical protein [Gammaproteobacteria bacterium]